MLNMKAEFVIYYVGQRAARLELPGRCRGGPIRVGDMFTWAYSYKRPGNTKGRRHNVAAVHFLVEAIVFDDWEGDVVTVRHEQQILPGQTARLYLSGEAPDLLAQIGERDILGIAVA
jgi:hypothetical protein